MLIVGKCGILLLVISSYNRVLALESVFSLATAV